MTEAAEAIEVSQILADLQGTPVNGADLMKFIHPQLTSCQRPSEFIVLDALPATSTGKILKHKLAESLRDS